MNGKRAKREKRRERAIKTTYGRRNAILREMGFKTYAEYLASDLWKGIRAEVLERDEGRCRFCGREADQAHHQTYSRSVLAGKRLQMILATCRGCHYQIEFDRYGEKRPVSWAWSSTKRRLVVQEAVAEQHAALDREWMQAVHLD